MPRSSQLAPAILGLFEKRIEGDDALMDLARLRFRQAGLGAEIHGATPAQIAGILTGRPCLDKPVVVHLARDFQIADRLIRDRIAEIAACFAGQVAGLVLHDHTEMILHADSYRRAADEMNSQLERIENSPMLFIEYAAGLDLEAFAGFFQSIGGLTRISACIDSGHVGIRQARNVYAERHRGEDICALKTQPARLPQVMTDVDLAVASALPAVLKLIDDFGALGKPVHFHLHDGHPLSTFSPFGVSDHLSFLAEIPLNFAWRGRRAAPLMFGPAGLARIVAEAASAIGAARVSLTLEVHPTGERLALDDAAPLFQHWRDKTNAEKMNHWLSVLAQNQRLLREGLRKRREPDPALDRGGVVR